ncbi:MULTISPECIES: hypothetical protein [Protofrankia]|uniref:Lipoprotein n=1 Tax=Candidatus Protofrankia datiscae TaxID=2716812 RepID=F8B1Z7_9ACTN|nr:MULTISPECIES: hypothetical protein [Protofrankia]AEH08866.1 hypothetical protein FsymDg_1395 [Candidatus Protofrankia datiscae]
MRRLPAVAAALVLMAGCGTFGDRGGPAPHREEKVDHVIFYQIYLRGGPGFEIYLNYTDATGKQQHDESIAPTWFRQITVRYPDVMLVAISGTAVPEPATLAGLAVQFPSTECVLTIDDEIVDQRASGFPTCQATLTATAHPVPRRSPI